MRKLSLLLIGALIAFGLQAQLDISHKESGHSINEQSDASSFYPSTSLHGTEQTNISWWNPVNSKFNVVEGSGWVGETEEQFDRLPLKAKGRVRDAVWSLSKHSAGLSLSFYTNASEITIRYQISGNVDMYHMPSTGVSGMDLYARDSEGGTHWIRGRRSQGDTIKYVFSGLTPNDRFHKLGREYTVYLPLYAQTKWMEIGVDESAFFQSIAPRNEKPIVVYGTSIAQGACATRPGTAWTGILTRELDIPLINLGFSGNGRLETELIDLLTEIDASVYVLDCLPNLSANTDAEFEIIIDKITDAVRQIRSRRPETPILLADHAGYTDGTLQSSREKLYSRLNMALAQALKKLGSVENLHHVSIDKFDQNIETMVDGTHPNDLGMFNYAMGYTEVIREILDQPVGNTTTTRPVRQRREPGLYEWENRHRQIINYSNENKPEMIVLGNSITHFWGGYPEGPIRRGPDSWDKYLGEETANFGIGWDRIENILWRIYHGELENMEPSTVLLMIGTNNLHLNNDAEMIKGYEFLIQAIIKRKPDTQLVVCGILPKKDGEPRVKSLNRKVSNLCANDPSVRFIDPGKIFLDKEGKLQTDYFTDGLHPNKRGYKILGKEISRLLK